MSVLANQLDQVIDKVQRLTELCLVLQEENDLLKTENDLLKGNLLREKEKVTGLEEKLRVLKLARSLEGTSEKTLDIKQKISEFVREIDKCIVLLKK